MTKPVESSRVRKAQRSMSLECGKPCRTRPGSPTAVEACRNRVERTCTAQGRGEARYIKSGQATSGTFGETDGRASCAAHTTPPGERYKYNPDRYEADANDFTFPVV